MAKITELFRYPVKGLSPEPMAALKLTRDHGIPFDREYALALGTTAFDPKNPEPLDKGFFLMLRNNEALAALSTKYDPQTARFSVILDGRTVLDVDLATDSGKDAVERFFQTYIGKEAQGRPKLVRSEGHKFTDASVVSPVFMRSVSIVNLASIQALEEAVGRSLHRLRFRGNIYLDGLSAWEELDWVDREITIATARLKGLARTPRCGAVNVNPETAKRDANLPKAIMHNFGHTDLGVFMEVLDDGEIRPGDDVITPRLV